MIHPRHRPLVASLATWRKTIGNEIASQAGCAEITRIIGAVVMEPGQPVGSAFGQEDRAATPARWQDVAARLIDPTRPIRTSKLKPAVVAAENLQRIYEELVASMRVEGAVCAITSGLACVYYGVAESTKDCDLLCHPHGFAAFLRILEGYDVEGVACAYRGNLSPPLDGRWHAGGWTSHFEWDFKPDPLLLDVFGQPLRQFSAWEGDLSGLYAGANTVAAMKRTARDKDWPFVSSLGLRMLEAGDERGWLHLFHSQELQSLVREEACPAHIAAQRPALQLAQANDPRLPGALNAERKLWEELDRRRIRIMEHALRPYVSTVRAKRAGRRLNLREDHDLRVQCALEHLPPSPVRDYGIRRLIEDCGQSLVASGVIPEAGLAWLPDVEAYLTIK